LKYLFHEKSEVYFRYTSTLVNFMLYNAFDRFFIYSRFYLASVNIFALEKDLDEQNFLSHVIFSKKLKIYRMSDKYFGDVKLLFDKGIIIGSADKLQNDFYCCCEPYKCAIKGNLIDCVVFVIKHKLPLLRKKPIFLKLKSLLDFKFESLIYKNNILLN
jgi:hypothetical protein